MFAIDVQLQQYTILYDRPVKIFITGMNFSFKKVRKMFLYTHRKLPFMQIMTLLKRLVKIT